MAKILVVGHINHDRIWQVDRHIQSGARHAYGDRQVRIGGGGFSTGELLMELGHEVILASYLYDDDYGHSALDMIKARGFDTSYIRFAEGKTRLAEILLDPDGERTILMPANRSKLAMPDVTDVRADAAYLNSFQLGDGAQATLQNIPLVVSQYPLQPVEPRPVDIFIGSKADLISASIQTDMLVDGRPDMPLLWHQTQAMDGTRLKALVITDGRHDISIYDGEMGTTVTPSTHAKVKDMTNAGDYFSAGFMHGLLAGNSLTQACQLAGQIVSNKLIAREKQRPLMDGGRGLR